ncbi:MAG: mechanosensitive ion channel family protein [Bacteroidales bacterium]|jgi:miniconductance mechanosensitive channel|nr:mechanosensitive ion channel family protein [Bacteroidales bacterium]
MKEKKIYILETIYNYFLESGLSEQLSNALVYIIACVSLILIIWLINFAGAHLISKLIKKTLKHLNSQWQNFLLQRKFYDNIIKLIAGITMLLIVNMLFQGFSPGTLKITETIITIYIMFISYLVINSFLNAANDVYETKPQAKTKSIRSFIQSIKIILVVFLVILIISILIQKNPRDLLLAIGASAAIFSLVFRDTILSFVASIQISAQEMFRPGDWIEMPARGADGMVTQINVTNVKVQNWDNSVTIIPTYAMVSESFTNWRNMQESAGRRFRRPVLIDVNSVTTLTQAQIDKIASHPAIDKKVSEKMMELMISGNTSNFITNLGLYRCYIEAFMNFHPKISKNQMCIARYLDNSDSGISIQIYAFSVDKTLATYERVVSDIMENLMVITPIFMLKFYQRPIAAKTEDSIDDIKINLLN